MESAAEAAYEASGCSSVADFISTPVCQSVQHAYLSDDVQWGAPSPLQEGKLGNLQFSLKKLRAREKPDGLCRFLSSLPTLIPSCTHLGLWVKQLASLDELAALCQGIASPLCTLRVLELKLSPKDASTDLSADARKRLVRDALVRNTSLEGLTITSDLCASEHWIPGSVKHLSVNFVGDDTLDVLLGVLTALAHNSISLTTLSITGLYDPSCDIDLSGFIRLAMLDSEKQLSATLSTNTSLTSLHLYNLTMPYSAFLMLFTALSKNPNLTDFSLCAYPYLPGKVVHMLFTALGENCSLKSLVLSYSNGEDWPSASSMLDMLQANRTLVEFEIDETPYEEELDDATIAALEAHLERNRKIAEQTNGIAALCLQ